MKREIQGKMMCTPQNLLRVPYHASGTSPVAGTAQLCHSFSKAEAVSGGGKAEDRGKDKYKFVI